MAGSWDVFSPPVSVGSFACDTMLLLTDGSVLVHNAYGADWLRLTPDIHGNYSTGSWSGRLPMSNSRQFFSSAVLRDGRVYVLGGEYSSAGGDTPLGEIFDPSSNSWSALTKPAEFNYIQGDASGTVLSDGRVLLGDLHGSSPPFKTAIWNPSDGVCRANLRCRLPLRGNGRVLDRHRGAFSPPRSGEF
jgi:hypothetical protein